MHLGPENILYNKKEQTMCVVKALTADAQFKDGLVYVTATIQVYQRDVRTNLDLPFPVDLELGDIDVTIDERCDEYEVGSKIPPHP